VPAIGVFENGNDIFDSLEDSSGLDRKGDPPSRAQPESDSEIVINESMISAELVRATMTKELT
jgi:hypothetical protein